MTQELKEKWVAALRSGEYSQCKASLKEDAGNGTVGYCCLGVLREIACPPQDFLTWDDRGYLSTKGLDAAGLTWEQARDLAYRNDGSGEHPRHDFREIADYIEADIPAEDSESTALNPEIAEPKAPQSASTKGESL